MEHEQFHKFFLVLFLAAQHRGLLIDPELVAYAYASHDYRVMTHTEQLQLNVLRMEVERIRIGMKRMTMLTRSTENVEVQLPQNRRRNAACAICFEEFSPLIITFAPFCGHVYCRSCFNACKRLNNRCGVCTMSFRTSNHYRIYLRFNYQARPVCRTCMIEITNDTPVRALRCGDVYCERCFLAMTDKCFACQGELGGSNRAIHLHISFH